MTGHRAFLGVYVDHLYQDCPNLTRAASYGKPRCGCGHPHRGVALVGDRLLGLVDPEGTDICRRCLRKWRSRA